MVTYLLDFHDNFRFSKTLSKYQEKPYPLLYFLIHLKSACNIRRILMDQSRNILIFNIPRILFANIPWNLIGNLFRILWEYIIGMFHEYSTNNISGTLFGNISRNFIGNVFRIFWEYIMGMFLEYSTNIYLPGGQ